jgi:hypothetical protein
MKEALPDWLLKPKFRFWIFFSTINCFIEFLPCSASAFEINDSSKFIQYRFIPTLYYLPETKIAFGGVLYAVIAPTDSTRKKGNLQHFLTLTQNRQLLLENSWQYFSKSNRYLFQGKADASHFPELFFGIGQPMSDCPPFLYSSNQINFQSQILKNIGNQLYGGISQTLNHLSKPAFSQSNSGNMEKLRSAPGGNGYWAKSLGASLVYDGRDFALNALKGMYVDFSVHQGWSSEGKGYQMLSFDGRFYHLFSTLKGTIAIQFVHRASFGYVPFRLMPSLGGPSLLRGYYAGQLRENRMAFSQLEWRQHLIGRFGLVLFAGAGNVANKYGNLLEEVHHQAGIGLRFQIRKSERINLRIDYAHTGKFSNFYVVLAEAF